MSDDIPETRETSGSGRLAILRWLVLVAVCFSALAFGFDRIAKSTTVASPFASGSDSSESAESGYPEPDFRLPSLDGPMIGPQDYAGDVVLIEFWATWCAPCRVQARLLEELHREFAGKDVHFLAIDSGEDEATVREFVANSPFPYPVLLDPDDTLTPRYRIYGLPTVMIIDRQGAISFFETGLTDANTLRAALAKAGAAV